MIKTSRRRRWTFPSRRKQNDFRARQIHLTAYCCWVAVCAPHCFADNGRQLDIHTFYHFYGSRRVRYLRMSRIGIKDTRHLSSIQRHIDINQKNERNGGRRYRKHSIMYLIYFGGRSSRLIESSEFKKPFVFLHHNHWSSAEQAEPRSDDRLTQNFNGIMHNASTARVYCRIETLTNCASLPRIVSRIRAAHRTN